jgi:PHP family Zn ribbon phosphoesterase
MNRREKRQAAWASIHGKQATSAGAVRPYLGLRFDCCGAYARAYRNTEGTAYEARCPRCGGAVRIRIGPDGTSHRFFRVY